MFFFVLSKKNTRLEAARLSSLNRVFCKETANLFGEMAL